MSVAGYLGRSRPERLTSGKELRVVLDAKSQEMRSRAEIIAREEREKRGFINVRDDYDRLLRARRSRP